LRCAGLTFTLRAIMNLPAKCLARAFALAGLLAAMTAAAAPADELLPPGYRPLPLGVHALVGGKVVVQPGEVIENGTVIIRDGLIQSVAKDAAVPEDARVWDMKGTTIYAGFIDPYLVLAATNGPVSTTAVEPVGSRSFTAGGFKFFGAPDARSDMGKPGPGYDLAKILPEKQMVRGYSPDDKMLAPLRELGFTVGAIAPAQGVVRGSSALVALVDDDPNRVVLKPQVFQHIAFETQAADDAGYSGSLMGVIAAVRQCFFDAQHHALERAAFARHPAGRQRPEFDPALEALEPALDKSMRVVFEPGSVLMDNRAAQVARELGLDFAIVSCGQEWRRPDLVQKTGVPYIVPLNFPTLPKLPNDGDWDQVSLDELRAWDWAAENPVLLRRQGLDIALTTHGLADKKDFRKNLQLAIGRGLTGTDALAALTIVPAKLCGVDAQLGTITAGKLANLTVVTGGGYFDPEAKVREVWIDGRIHPIPVEEPKAAKSDDTNSTPVAVAADASATNAPHAEKTTGKKDKDSDQSRELRNQRTAHSPMEGRGPLTNSPTILIRNAVVWTCGPQGILTNADVLIADGKIKQVGSIKTDPAPGTLVLDAAGEQVTPGIVDCHNHSFVLGGVNESTLPSSAMVRISDVINSETANVHEQLAGGVTVAHVLHGSANPIGGQNCPIKLRDGASPEEMVITNAPGSIKFALGENVKQSNWGDKSVTRFPQTRMGVRTFIQNRFIAAQDYLKQWDDYRASQNGAVTNDALVPPRRDLELEALGEVLQGKRFIHCHAYRQDEMLALLRLMQGFGVQMGSYQHGLEGYKIADELAAAHVGVSTFSDWWAYKFEVYDAIPYNGSLMRERGVLVSFNSDSSELARRLYLEAAKAVKDGGTPEADALDFVTINPAKQMRIDQSVGSLEPGKDADFAIWSKSPLDSGTVCLQTWIDGKKYFDRSLEPDRAARLKKERDDLIAKAKKVAALADGGDDSGDDGGAAFFRVSLEHEFDGRERHCLDGD
jgi:imidazolonepropionase-like amidohydrolase